MVDEMKNMMTVDGPNGAVVLYTSQDGSVRLDVQIEGQTVWLSQQQMAVLYGKAVSTINEHLKNVFSEKELSEEGCVKKFGISEFQQKAPLY